MHETTRTRRLVPGRAMLLAAAVIVAPPALAQDEDRPFRSMAVDDERETLCEMPEVPADLAYTNAENDAYEYWREKLELERRLETGECDCNADVVSWEEVGEQALPWLEDYREQPSVKRLEIRADIEALEAQFRGECAG